MKVMIFLSVVLLTAQVFASTVPDGNLKIGAYVSRCKDVNPGVQSTSQFVTGESFVVRPSDFVDGTLKKTFDDKNSGRLSFQMQLVHLEDEVRRISILVKYTSADGKEEEGGHLNLRYGHDAFTNTTFHSCNEKSDEGALNLSIRANGD